jgi:hypothetical protein
MGNQHQPLQLPLELELPPDAETPMPTQESAGLERGVVVVWPPVDEDAA